MVSWYCNNVVVVVVAAAAGARRDGPRSCHNTP